MVMAKVWQMKLSAVGQLTAAAVPKACESIGGHKNRNARDVVPKLVVESFGIYLFFVEVVDFFDCGVDPGTSAKSNQ